MWLENAKFYRLNFKKNSDGFIDNPDQRIAEDSLLLVEKSVDLLKSFVYNIAKLVAFVVILWEISKVINFNLFGINFELSGFLVYIALFYTLICSIITHLIGRRLKDLNFTRQQVEANYRSDLIMVRENAEALAFLKAAEQERVRFRDSFKDIIKNWKNIMATEFRLECFWASYLRITNLIPIFACLPLYFARTMSLGDMMQARSAFYSVQDGFAWFMDYYKRIMEWAASVERVYKFINALARTKVQTKPKQSEIINASDISVQTPLNENLTQGLSFSLTPSKWLLLNGKSGSGKSTLLRYIAGIWEFGSGDISMPKRSDLHTAKGVSGKFKPKRANSLSKNTCKKRYRI